MLPLLLLVLQTDETIPRAQRAIYEPAAADCAKAKALLLEGKAQDAIDLLTPILENRDLKKIECRLRIEQSPGTYSAKYDFFPYHFRGRARLLLAEKAGDPETARKRLREAEKDLDESDRRGLGDSRKHLDAARERIRKLGEMPAVDPEPEFRRKLQGFLEEHRFGEAKRHVETQGGFLASDKRAIGLADIDRACRKALEEATEAFLVRLEEVRSKQALTEMDAPTLARSFRLPKKEDLTLTTPEYDWSLSVRSSLEELRGGRDALDALLEQAPPNDARRFRAIETLAYDIAREEVLRRATEARDAESPRRAELRGEADGLVKRWKRLPSTRTLDGALAEFPADYAGLAGLVETLKTAVESADPAGDLSKFEKSLPEFGDLRNRLAIESRREIVRCRIAAGALRRLLAGSSVEGTARDLRDLGKELAALRGSFEMDLLGPKVREVFRRLQ